MPPKKLIGKILIEAGLITPDKLEEALARQKGDERRIGKIMLEMGLLDETEFLQHLAAQLGISFVSLPQHLLDPTIVKIIPEYMCHKYRLIAISNVGNRLTVAMDDPLDIIAIDDVQLRTGLLVKPMIASESAIMKALHESFSILTP